MVDKLMYIPDDNKKNSMDQNYWLKSLDTDSFRITNHNSMKMPKVFELNNKNKWLKNFG